MRVADGPPAAGWGSRQLIELCLLAGHHEMLAMTLNSLGVEPEPSALARLSGDPAEAAARVRDGLAVVRRA